MNKPILVVFCGGGSGGHLSPGIAVAEQILEVSTDSSFLFVTSAREVDRRMLQTSGLPADQTDQLALPVTGFRRRISHVLQLARDVLRCLSRFRQQRPDIVIGTGGFASVPGILAARILRIPLALIELNTVPGRVNRLLNRFAAMTFVGWPLEKRFAAAWKSPLQEVGVPLRRAFCPEPDVSPKKTQKTVLVLGGSQGANGLNQLVTTTITMEDVLPDEYRLLHQAGVSDQMSVRECYRMIGREAEVVSFVEDIGQALKKADLVISRAGAVTLAEIAATGTASVLIPLPNSADNHQLKNARHFEQAGGAKVILQTDDSALKLLMKTIRELTENPEHRRNLADHAAQLASASAASDIAAWIIDSASSPA